MKTTINLFLQNGINEKTDQFEKFIDRIIYLTSDKMWAGTVETCKQGMYFTLEKARSKFQVYVNCHGHVERKPRNIEFNRKFYISGYGRELEKVR